MPVFVEAGSPGKATCHDAAMASGSSTSLRGWLVLAYLRPVVGCCRIRDSQGSRGTKVSAALEEGEKSEIGVVQARYYGVVSARVTYYSIGSEASALLAALSQPVIPVDRSSDSEVFRVTRGIGKGCSTRFVAFPVAFQISRFRSQNYCGKTTRRRRWRRCRSGSCGRRRTRRHSRCRCRRGCGGWGECCCGRWRRSKSSRWGWRQCRCCCRCWRGYRLAIMECVLLRTAADGYAPIHPCMEVLVRRGTGIVIVPRIGRLDP